MGRGRPVIRIRSREEQQRRKLLFLGVPLFAIGSALIWHFTTPEDSTPNKPGIGQITQATPEQTLQQIEIPDSRKDEASAPPAIPEPKESRIQTTQVPNSQEDIQQASTPPKHTDSTEAPQVVSASVNKENSLQDRTTEITTTTPLKANIAAANENKLVTTQQTLATVETKPENQTEVADTKPKQAETDLQTEQVKAQTEESPQPTNVVTTHTEETQQAEKTEKQPEEIKQAEKTKTVSEEIQQAEKAKKQSEEAKQASTEEVTPEIIDNGKRGWVYAGQFRNGNWVKRGLMIDNQLPQTGQQYKLAWGSKLRNSPPRKRTSSGSNLGDQIGFLQQGVAVQVVTVKQSGRNGHIWLEIQQ